jgi:hypothetical protein
MPSSILARAMMNKIVFIIARARIDEGIAQGIPDPASPSPDPGPSLPFPSAPH